jgi:lysophospholipase L1-like esterase
MRGTDVVVVREALVRHSTGRSSVQRLRAGLLAVLIVVLLSGCAAAARPSSGSTRMTTTVAVVGDSLTAGARTAFSPYDIDPNTWVAQLTSSSIEVIGGWAVPGSTTAVMRAYSEPTDPDVLVILAGTNDVSGRVPASVTEANIVAIRRIEGGSRVLLSAIPPNVYAPKVAVALNAALRSLAVDHHWYWVDPWVAVRSGTAYAKGASADGIHPLPPAAKLVGEAMQRAILKIPRN